jgi:hypothetical protein
VTTPIENTAAVKIRLLGQLEMRLISAWEALEAALDVIDDDTIAPSSHGARPAVKSAIVDVTNAVTRVRAELIECGAARQL